jgi:uncharacterized protein YxeA
MTRATRAVILVLAVCLLAILAGVLAVRAFAEGTDNYCYPCLLQTDGVPAVSQAHHSSFYSDDMETYTYSESYYTEAVYFYSASQNRTMCYVAAYTNEDVGTYVDCINVSKPSDTDARCHLTSGPHSTDAVCDAHYSAQ